MNQTFHIRKMTVGDAIAVTELSAELGYTMDPTILESQIVSILADKTHEAYVAVMDDELVGYIHGFWAVRITTPPFLEIGALVVAGKYRRLGIGEKLVRYMEQTAVGVDAIRVRCNRKREGAHQFYQTLGYVEKKEQKVFERKVKNGGVSVD